MYFEPNNFVMNLQYMAKGMIGIFAVISIIIIITYLVNVLFKSKK